MNATHLDVRLHGDSCVNHLKEVILKMKFGKIGLACATLFLLSAVSLTALAQGAGQATPGQPGQGGGRQGQGGFGRGGMVILPISYLNTSLKLTADQKDKITAIQTQYKEDAKAFTPPPADPNTPVDPQVRRDMGQKRGAAVAKADADITALLTDDQKKMMADMNKELGALRSVGIPIEVLADLKLSETQRTQIVTISDDSQKEMRAKRQEAQANGGQFDRQAMQDMRKATTEKAMNVLNLSQKNKLEAYLKDHPQPQGGGRGGRQGAPPPGAPPQI
jgi:hypothetical protein